MEMHQLRYFLAVCDQGNFTRAARVVYVSQPSLTQAIKKLEDELGGELFTRDRSGCRLTALGRLVEPGLRKIYDEALLTKAAAVRFNRLNTIPLRIGLMESIGAQRLSPLLARYQQQYPNVELELIVASEKNLSQQFQAESLDILISSPPQLLGAPYLNVLLYKERYVAAFRPGHRFSRQQSVELQDIQPEPYLDRLNCELREKLKSICQTQGIALYAAYRSNSEEWILHMVRAGLGVAVMPEYSVPREADDIRYCYISNPEISREIYATYLPQMLKKPELGAFISNLCNGL